MTGEGRELMIHGGPVLPAGTPEQIKDALGQYQKMCEAILTPDDYQNVAGRQFKKKSAARKLDLAYNISHGEDLLEDTEVELAGGERGWKIRAVAIAPNGRTAIGDGFCDTMEKPGFKLHDIRATAVTRAMNRATFNLVAMGEVSAEEVSEETQPKPQPVAEEPKEAEPDRSDLPPFKWIEESIVLSHGYSIAGLKPYVPSDGKMAGRKLYPRDKLFKRVAPTPNATESADLPEGLNDDSLIDASQIAEDFAPEQQETMKYLSISEKNVLVNAVKQAGLLEQFNQVIKTKTGTRKNSWATKDGEIYREKAAEIYEWIDSVKMP